MHGSSAVRSISGGRSAPLAVSSASPRMAVRNGSPSGRIAIARSAGWTMLRPLWSSRARPGLHRRHGSRAFRGTSSSRREAPSSSTTWSVHVVRPSSSRSFSRAALTCGDRTVFVRSLRVAARAYVRWTEPERIRPVTDIWILNMRTWYSPRGARRGLLLALIAAAVWLSWAIGFVQGSRPAIDAVDGQGRPSLHHRVDDGSRSART